MNPTCGRGQYSVVLGLCVLMALALSFTSPAGASYTLDRWYRMGDDSEEPAEPGQPAGTGAFGGLTFDSIGQTGQGNYQDLTPFGSPLYVDISSGQPFPNSTLDNRAISFDGSTQYLRGHFLNDPEEADLSTGQVEDYTGIHDRGYQMWFKTTAIGAEQSVLDDADVHRTVVLDDGSMAFETRSDVVTSSTDAMAGDWTHVAQVRPDGDYGGSMGWINGRAAVSQTGNYPSSTLGLVIGADIESDGLGGETITPQFQGLVSDVEMFVLGGAFGTYSYVTDNGYFTDVYLPSTSGYGYSDADSDGHNDVAWINGDINFDGALTSDDVLVFISGWLARNEADVAGAGPGVGDYVTLGLGDLDLDGDTDADDWVVLRATGVSPPAGMSLKALGIVPEPGGFVMALMFLFGLFGARRVRRA